MGLKSNLSYRNPSLSLNYAFLYGSKHFSFVKDYETDLKDIPMHIQKLREKRYLSVCVQLFCVWQYLNKLELAKKSVQPSILPRKRALQ
jgi:hypothetical protein